ncbi:GNAT family N-acetyltransferase [Parasphingopyxis algicola]|uniref:GNAT family N-acetyltransferase n=1 Tax=Parasphingopyxis algicola TaxID=2026624 RepID=UPI0015A4C47D|nr:GNAT family N-acetyltransferase [Parasphingopyxis algicola]QLC24915.1 GNAT family N-acetyltransferase [Parasphingopyxis algicola]
MANKRLSNDHKTKLRGRKSLMKQSRFGAGRKPRGPVEQFSPKVGRCARTSRAKGNRLRRARWEEIVPWLNRARRSLDLADTDHIKHLLAHNSDLIRLIIDQRTDEPRGFFAYLPLNERGAMSIVSGGFSGRAPDSQLIAPAGQTPTAIYFWLTYAPGALASSVCGILDCLGAIAPQGCPIFSRSVTAHSKRLSEAIGFEPAQRVYPNAPDWLQVCLPQKDMPDTTGRTNNAPTIEVLRVRTVEELTQVISVRSAVYMAEQLCRFDEEFDGNDLCATQFLGLVNGDPAGCIRLRYFGDFAKLERLAVRKQYRKSRLAYRLVRTALDHARQKNFLRIYGHSRDDLVRFWQIFGFRLMDDRPTFTFANVDYREMVAELEPDDRAIRFGVNPMIAIRQEGFWDEEGPLERSNHVPDPVQAAKVAHNMRRLGA